MYKIGFDNDKYLSLQSEKIKERIAKFGGKRDNHQTACRRIPDTASAEFRDTLLDLLRLQTEVFVIVKTYLVHC